MAKLKKILSKVLAGSKNVAFIDFVSLLTSRRFWISAFTDKRQSPHLYPSKGEGTGQLAECQWTGQAVSNSSVHGIGGTVCFESGESMKDYHINIFYSEEDEGYIADIPDMVHCSAFGNTPEEALFQALVAKKAWLDAARAEGKPIPAPMYRPVIYQAASMAG